MDLIKNLRNGFLFEISGLKYSIVFESKYLNIDSSKASKILKWKPKLSIKNAVDLTVEWYDAFLTKKNLLALTSRQIRDYLSTK